jgi:glycosyltransferase involved in cell wall biosynthesis
VEGPLVSIITPTYNHEAFIARCIDSVLVQTYGNWEMIILDDGSTDRTGEVVQGYTDPRIRYCPQENKGIDGLGDTYNRGLSLAKGEIIAILEGDDFWPEYKLEIQLRDFTEPQVVLSSGLTCIVDENEQWLSITPLKAFSAAVANNQPVGYAGFWMLNPYGLTFTFPVATMIRKTALEAIGGFQKPSNLPLVDFPTFLRLSLEGEFRFRLHFFGYWRRHGGSTTKSKLNFILEQAWKHGFSFLAQYRDRIPVSDADLDGLQRDWHFFMVQVCVVRGRMLASKGKWKLARKALSEGLLYERTRKTDLAIRVSKFLCLFHISPEFLFRIFRRGEWEKIVNLESGDVLVTEADMERERVVCRWRSA